MTSFTAWLRSQAHRNDPVGDLSRDLRSERCAPRRATPERLRSHLALAHSACSGALEALDQAAREWAA